MTTRTPRPAGRRLPSPAARPFSLVPPFTAGPAPRTAKAFPAERLPYPVSDPVSDPAHACDPGAPSADNPAPDAESAARASATAAALVRWAAFSCALTPVTLLACGTALTTALGTATGLTLVTAACGVLLHRSQRAYAQQGSGRFATGGPGPHRGRHSRTGTGLHRGGRPWASQSEP